VFPFNIAKSLSTSERASRIPQASSTCAVVDLLDGIPWFNARK